MWTGRRRTVPPWRGTDYIGASGTLTFAAGETAKTVSVSVLADAVAEDGETLTLALSNASGATLADASATGTILDAAPAQAPGLTALFEGVPSEHDGESVFTFRVRFSEAPGVSFKVLRDEWFAVSGGAVRKARRVNGQNDLREIHVEPSGCRARWRWRRTPWGSSPSRSSRCRSSRRSRWGLST